MPDTGAVQWISDAASIGGLPFDPPPYDSYDCDLWWKLDESSGFFRSVSGEDLNPSNDGISYGSTVTYDQSGLIPSAGGDSAKLSDSAIVSLTRPSGTSFIRSRAVEFTLKMHGDYDAPETDQDILIAPWHLVVKADGKLRCGVDVAYGTIYFNYVEVDIPDSVRDKIFDGNAHHIVMQGIQYSYVLDSETHREALCALSVDGKREFTHVFEDAGHRTFESSMSAIFYGPLQPQVDEVKLYATIGDGDGYLEDGVGLSDAKVWRRYRSWKNS